MNIKNNWANCLLIAIIVFLGLNISGCTEKSESYSPIKYGITIETDNKITVYLPVLLDLPNNTVADLVYLLEVDKKESDIEVTFDVIDTIHGEALRIDTTGNVSLKAVSSFKYYDTHPEMPITQFKAHYENNPKFFNISMKINETNPYTSFHWAYLETNDTDQVKVRIYNGANTKIGGEYYYSLSDGSDERNRFLTIKPGWQAIGFQRKVGYY